MLNSCLWPSRAASAQDRESWRHTAPARAPAHSRLSSTLGGLALPPGSTAVPLSPRPHPCAAHHRDLPAVLPAVCLHGGRQCPLALQFHRGLALPLHSSKCDPGGPGSQNPQAVKGKPFQESEPGSPPHRGASEPTASSSSLGYVSSPPSTHSWLSLRPRLRRSWRSTRFSPRRIRCQRCTQKRRN